jgi:hypothetical protein
LQMHIQVHVMPQPPQPPQPRRVIQPPQAPPPEAGPQSQQSSSTKQR